MGCNTSRLDRLPAVALCRDRCEFLEAALRQSYALADAHVAHMESLKTLGSALHSFFNGIHNEEDPIDGDGTADHSLNLPTNNLNSQLAKSSSPLTGSSFSSDSDSQIPLHFDSEPEDIEKDLHDFNRSHYDYLNHDTVSSAPDNVVFMNSSQPLYTPFSPPLPKSSGYLGSKLPSLPPPSSSAWDFLNLFETFEKYQVPKSPSREEKEKEKNYKNVGGGDADGSKCHQSKVNREQNGQGKNTTKGDSENNKPEDSKNTSNLASAKVNSPKRKGVSEVMKEIQIQFERVSDSGSSILELLDVGKLRYHRKIAVNQVSCKMMHVFTPCISSAATSMESSSLLGRITGSSYTGVDQDKGLNYGNLSCTMKKLCMWEKKLYDEVKSEEKLRILNEKKCRQLRRMNRRGADAHKIDSVQTFISILSTKMKISIQVVDKLSNTVTKLREEELWPQINEFILRFLEMWKDMLECYRCQYQAIAKAKCSDAKLSITHLDTAIKLKAEIQKWNLSFSDWIYAQKSHVKALNGWLLRCLLCEPEEISGGTAPFSPGKIGAPPVFVVCNKWSQVVDKISEKDVIEALNGFMICLNEILERHILGLQQKSTEDKELERKVKDLERQEQKMHEVLQARERKMVSITREETDTLLSGDAVRLNHVELDDRVNPQSSLKSIFAAMERLSANTVRAYEELRQHIEQESALREFNSTL